MKTTKCIETKSDRPRLISELGSLAAGIISIFCGRAWCARLLLGLSLCLAGFAFAPPALAQALPLGVTNLPAFRPPPVPGTPPANLAGMMNNVPRPPPLQTGTRVVTDQADYAPGVTAHIRGQEFQAGETVRLQVLHADGTSDGGADHQPWTVVAGGDSGFHATWHVCEDDCVGSALRLTAVGVTSGRVAQALFTDAPAAPTYQQLKAFGAPSPGGYPQSGLLQGTDGALYGTASAGGSFGYGTVFKLNPDGGGFSVLMNLDYFTTGSFPSSGLLQGTDGALYGTATYGGSSGYGTVFKLNTDGTGFTVLRNFGYTDGAFPHRAALIQGTDGALYGTAFQGGNNGVGTVFKLNTDGTGFTVLKNLDYSTTGGFPQASLMQGTDGALYGVTGGGGGHYEGTVFKLNRDGTGFTVLENFDYSATGGNPISGLLQATDGALYGTTYQGGSGGYGTVFKLNPDGSGFSVLKNFDTSTTGGALSAGLLQGTDGALYSTTGQGPTFYNVFAPPAVFKLNTDGTGFRVLVNFDYYVYGFGGVQGGLIQGTDGALYGTGYEGGSAGFGTVFKLNQDGTGFSVLKNLSTSADISGDGGSPQGGVIQGTDGKLYGTTSGGGGSGGGTVFKLNPDGTGITVLKNFDIATIGGYLRGGLIQGTGGAIFGTASYGGNSSAGNGTVFKLNPDGSGFSAFGVFTNFSTTGASPQSELIQGSDGALYGTTYRGGSTGYGTVFKLNPDGSGFSVLKSFGKPPPGIGPSSGLVKGTDGALYGTANRGGTFGYGTVFKLSPDGTRLTVIQNFDYATTGAYPSGGLIQGTDGALYGTAGGGSNGYGIVFKLNPDGTGFAVLKNDFDSTTGGLSSGLIQGTDGALYGTTYRGGSFGYGTVVKLNTDGTGFSVLKNFSYSDGAYLGSALIQGTDGALYGTAEQGGSFGYGTVFKLNMDGTGFSVLENFNNSTPGSYPAAGLLQGTDGNFYGTASGGGDGYGTVFRLNAEGTGFTVLKNFDYSTTGGYPNGELIQGTDGALYGTTYLGGSGDAGTVFKLNPDGTGFSVLKNFDYYTTGRSYYGLVQGTDGALYGTTYPGGSSGNGTIFRLSTDGSRFSVLKDFPYGADISEDGGDLQAGLMQGTDGALYGVASSGGSGGVGTVFKLNPDGTGFSVLKHLDYATTGGKPEAGLLQGMDGALYGVASSGGSGGVGTVFKLNLDGTGFSVLKNLDFYTTGGNPSSGLLQMPDGTLYGTALNGGSSYAGTVFQLNPDGSDFSVVLNFDHFSTGGSPTGKLMKGTDGDLYGTTSQDGYGSGTVFRLVFPSAAPINLPPLAKCKNVTVSAGANCTAAASIDDGSFDPDTGDTITATQTPAGPYPLGPTSVTLTVTDNHGAASTCIATVTVRDTTAPTITCPANFSVGCSVERLATVSYSAPTVFDNCDAHPTVTCTPASGTASFAVGVNTVACTAVDASGNRATCSFTVTRAALGFTGFSSPIGGEVARGTGGSFSDPLRAFKLGSTIPVKFLVSCGGTSVATGVHTLQATKYSNSVDSDPVIDATPTDSATTGNQFRLTDAASGEWHFNLNTKLLSVGTWKLTATLSDGTIHEVWITIKK